MADLDHQARLIGDGYTVVSSVLDMSLLERLRPASERLLDAMTPEEQRARLSTGSLVSLWHDPVFAELIGWQPMWQAVRALGFAKPRFSNGYVVSKPGQSPRTFWHHDWWGWHDPHSYGPFVHQLGCLFYFDATNRDNGCLRVIPGSHQRRHALHVATSDEQVRALRRYDDPGALQFADAAGEVDVPVGAGDMVLIDARLLHATHANARPQRRTAVLCWLVPDLAGWSPQLRRRHPRHTMPESWPAAAQAMVSDYLIDDGPVGRTPEAYGLSPGEALR